MAGTRQYWRDSHGQFAGSAGAAQVTYGKAGGFASGSFRSRVMSAKSSGTKVSRAKTSVRIGAGHAGRAARKVGHANTQAHRTMFKMGGKAGKKGALVLAQGAKKGARIAMGVGLTYAAVRAADKVLSPGSGGRLWGKSGGVMNGRKGVPSTHGGIKTNGHKTAVLANLHGQAPRPNTIQGAMNAARASARASGKGPHSNVAMMTRRGGSIRLY